MLYDGPKTARILIKNPAISGYQQRLNDYNFICNLSKVANFYFLESVLECLKTCQKSDSYHNPVGNKMSFKIWKKCLFRGRFFQEQ